MKTAIIAIILAAIVLSASAYGAYSLINTTSPSPTPTSTPTTPPTITPNPTQPTTPNPTIKPTTEPTKTPTSTSPTSSTTSPRFTSSFNPIDTIISDKTATYVIIKDVYGNDVNVTLPVNKVVSISSGITEIIYAIGAGDKVVGRDSYSVNPTAVLTVPIVASTSASPNTELIVELKPDLIIADTMLSNATRANLESLTGAPLLIESASQSDLVVPLVTALGTVLQKEEKAEDLVDFMTSITNLVETRIKNLSDSDRPLVYYEWNKAWYSCSSLGYAHQMITDAGGKNLAANGTVTYPTLSSEYVFECNPKVVVRILSDTTHNLTDYQGLRGQLMTRTGLVGTKAVDNGDVYVLSSSLRTGIKNPIGLLTMAKWFHPTLFADVDPVALHTEMVQTFFGESLTGTYSYP